MVDVDVILLLPRLLSTLCRVLILPECEVSSLELRVYRGTSLTRNTHPWSCCMLTDDASSHASSSLSAVISPCLSKGV